MQLLTVHKVLIGSAIATGVIFSVSSFVAFLRGGGGTHVVMGTLALGATVSLAFYLRHFLRRYGGGD
jgi:hypothetical protein